MLGRKRDARAQIPLPRDRDAVIQQGLVLRFVVGVAVQESFARQLRHLLPDELLLIEAVTQPLLGLRRIELQLLQHEV